MHSNSNLQLHKCLYLSVQFRHCSATGTNMKLQLIASIGNWTTSLKQLGNGQ